MIRDMRRPVGRYNAPVMLKRVFVIGVLVLVLLGLLFYSQLRPEVRTVSGFVEAHEVRIGSRVGGRVLKVDVQEGDNVTVGQPLVELEPYDLQQRKASAEAELAQRRQRYAELLAGPRPQDIDAARGRVKVAEAQVTLATISRKQVKDVFDKGASSQEELDRVTAQLDSAQGSLESAQAQLDLLLAGTRAEELEQAKAAVEAQEAALAALQVQIDELVIRASIDGQVEALDLRPGDLVGPNAPVLTLLDGGELWVRAYVPENNLNLQIGDELPVTVDSYPDRTFKGKVTFIAGEGEFTPRNVQTPEERSKQVFRIKVVLDEEAKVLHPGMSADVWINGSGER